jgi:hypothetical protein
MTLAVSLSVEIRGTEDERRSGSISTPLGVRSIWRTGSPCAKSSMKAIQLAVNREH